MVIHLLYPQFQRRKGKLINRTKMLILYPYLSKVQILELTNHLLITSKILAKSLLNLLRTRWFKSHKISSMFNQLLVLFLIPKRCKTSLRYHNLILIRLFFSLKSMHNSKRHKFLQKNPINMICQLHIQIITIAGQFLKLTQIFLKNLDLNYLK